MSTLSATTLRTALVDYRAEMLRLANKYPQMYSSADDVIKSIDGVLMSIEGNVTSVNITPNTCNPNR